MGSSIIEIIEEDLKKLKINSYNRKNILKEIIEETRNIEEIKGSEGLCKLLGINYEGRIKKIEEEKDNKLIKKLDKRKTKFNKSFVKKLEQICSPDQIKALFLYHISVKARQHNEKLVLSKDLMDVDYLNVFIKELNKTFKNLIKKSSIKGKKIFVSESKGYRKDYYKKNKIAKLEEELSKHKFTDESAIKKMGFNYLERISKSIERDNIGEIALEWLKYKKIINQREITKARQKRYLPKSNYKKESSEETLVEKTKIENTADRKNLEEKVSKKPKGANYYEKTLVNDDKNESYKPLIDMINATVENEMQGCSKQKIKEFVIGTLAKNWGEYIKHSDDIINVKKRLKGYFTDLENFDNALNNKAEEIFSEICNGTLIIKKSYKKYISFIEMHGYTDTRIKSAISSGKIPIMRNVCYRLQGWINSKTKNKKHYNEFKDKRTNRDK